MKKKLIPFVLTFGLVGITGCMGMLPENQQEVNAMEKNTELTQEKKDFLKKIFAFLENGRKKGSPGKVEAGSSGKRFYSSSAPMET